MQTTYITPRDPSWTLLVTVPASRIPARWGWYQRHVLEDGHQPGVLSGAELAGKARNQFGGSYAASRRAVEALLAEYDVRSELVLMASSKTSPKRVARVWLTASNHRALVVIDEDA